MLKQYIMDIVRSYGFIECADILFFLKYLNNEKVDQASLSWISSKLNECLVNHDDGKDYFIALRKLRNDIIKFDTSHLIKYEK